MSILDKTYKTTLGTHDEICEVLGKLENMDLLEEKTIHECIKILEGCMRNTDEIMNDISEISDTINYVKNFVNERLVFNE